MVYLIGTDGYAIFQGRYWLLIVTEANNWLFRYILLWRIKILVIIQYSNITIANTELHLSLTFMITSAYWNNRRVLKVLTSRWNISSSCVTADSDVYNCTKCISISHVTCQGQQSLLNCSVRARLRCVSWGTTCLLWWIKWAASSSFSLWERGERIKTVWKMNETQHRGMRLVRRVTQRKVKGPHSPFYLCEDERKREIDSVDSTFVTADAHLSIKELAPNITGKRM